MRLDARTSVLSVSIVVQQMSLPLTINSETFCVRYFHKLNFKLRNFSTDIKFSLNNIWKFHGIRFPPNELCVAKHIEYMVDICHCHRTLCKCVLRAICLILCVACWNNRRHVKSKRFAVFWGLKTSQLFVHESCVSVEILAIQSEFLSKVFPWSRHFNRNIHIFVLILLKVSVSPQFSFYSVPFKNVTNCNVNEQFRRWNAIRTI